jgi:hypothetical protein
VIAHDGQKRQLLLRNTAPDETTWILARFCGDYNSCACVDLDHRANCVERSATQGDSEALSADQPIVNVALPWRYFTEVNTRQKQTMAIPGGGREPSLCRILPIEHLRLELSCTRA